MRLHNKIRWIAVLLLGVWLPVAVAAPQSAGTDGLGDSLLDPGSLEKLFGPSAPANPPKPAAPSRPNGPAAGEDVGQSPLVRAEAGMQAAGRLISQRDLSGQTGAMQGDVVAALDDLVKQLEKQCQQCQGGGQSKPSGQQQSQSSMPKPGGKQPGKNGAQAAAQSTASTGGGRPKTAANDPQSPTTEAKQLWGQLPERLRQQLQQGAGQDFLPKYRAEIEAYFQRLAEEP